MIDNINTTAQTTAPTIKRQMNGTTYIVRVHFNENTKETMEDKIKRLLRNEVRQNVNCLQEIVDVDEEAVHKQKRQ